jgi:hypothetical protein
LVTFKSDAFVKSRKTPFSVIPAKAGIQEKQALLDPGFRRGDGFDDFLRTHQHSIVLEFISQSSKMINIKLQEVNKFCGSVQNSPGGESL